MRDTVASLLHRARARGRGALKGLRARALSTGAGVVWRVRQARWKLARRPAPATAASPPAAAPRPPAGADVVSSDRSGPAFEALVRFTRPPSSIRSAAGTDAPYAAVVGPATIVTRGWLEPLIETLEADPSLDAAASWTEPGPPPFAWSRMAEGGGVNARLSSVPPGAVLLRRATLGGGDPLAAARRAAESGKLSLVEESLVLGHETPPLFGDRALRALAIRREALERREAIVREGLARFEGRSVLFVLPVADRGGGANVVLSEARAMGRMGVDARVLNVTPLRPYFEKGYPDPGVPMLWAFPDAVAAVAERFDAVVATANTSVPWIAALAGKGPVIGYYVQDYEPWFYPDDAFRRSNAVASYTLVPGMRLVTKTEWNRDVVRRETGAEATVIGASFDADLNRPRRPAPPEVPLRVAAMIRPASPRRAPARTMRVLARAARELGDGLEVLTFGVAADDAELRALPRAFPHTHLGVLDDRALAELLASVHVFADFSDFQAMGLTALEAMGCGTTALLPEAGGASSFATHGENALLVDTRSEEACAEALLLLARDLPLRSRLINAAPAVACRHSVEACALATLEALFSG